MYWRVSLDQFRPPAAVIDKPRGGDWLRAVAQHFFTNPLRLARAPASPFAGEEGDQISRIGSHA